MIENYEVLNKNTGEIFEVNCGNMKNKKISKVVIDDMLRNADSFDEIDGDLLRHWLYMINEINKKNDQQFRLWGESVDNNVIFIKPLEENITKYISAIIPLAHVWSNRLMKTQRTGITSWGDLWNTIGCKNRNTQSKVKKFLDYNNLVRKVTVSKPEGDSVQFYLNPFIFRNRHFINQVAINVFRDCAKESINLQSYTYRYLQKIDVLDR